MSQDTRKDKRAKVVSLNVRYKSATVDEFIENHSHDVSKGGIFVKTPTPFPPGTLLKFEIRLAGDKSVISGVGRVVWKREPTQAGNERPAGMGVKFIKIDDASRKVIDTLVDSRGVILGYIGWDQLRPGLALVRKIAPALAIALLLAGGVLAFLLRRLRRASAALQTSQDEAQYLAFHDTLTGLPNRALFEDRLRRIAHGGGGGHVTSSAAPSCRTRRRGWA